MYVLHYGILCCTTCFAVHILCYTKYSPVLDILLESRYMCSAVQCVLRISSLQNNIFCCTVYSILWTINYYV
jgi:hypothetical protein